MKQTFFSLVVFFSLVSHAGSWPAQPSEYFHPGSAVYANQLFHETLTFNGRTIDFFAPAGFQNVQHKLSVVVYGHGQAVPLTSYQDTFEHLARKGVAVIFPQYDSGFFDQDWRRMAADYVQLTSEVLKKYPNSLDGKHVIFSGHSKGAYVASVAAGLPADKLLTPPAGVVLFDPAGYDSEYLQNYDVKIPVTVTWADKDTIVKESLVKEIYQKLPSQRKQFIRVQSYLGTTPDLTADHFFVLSKKFTFGGKDGITPFHYYGAWKWLLGAIWDVEAGSPVTNTFIYGDQASSTGITEKHQIQKNW